MSIRTIAKRRHDIHKNHASSRPLSKDYELVGLSGEIAFGEFADLKADLSERPEGDHGIDFTTPNGMTIDVKTARRAYNLIHETGKQFVDIYRATLIGWEYGNTLAKAPSKNFGYGIINHYISKDKLRPMLDIKKVCEI